MQSHPWYRIVVEMNKAVNSQDIDKHSAEQQEFYQVLLQRTRMVWATPMLFVLLLLVFIIMFWQGVSIIAPSSEDMLRWGANAGLMTLSGEYWRIVTSGFLHFGAMHLIFNLWALAFMGPFAERLVGSVNFFVDVCFGHGDCGTFGAVFSSRYSICGCFWGYFWYLWHGAGLGLAGACAISTSFAATAALDYGTVYGD